MAQYKHLPIYKTTYNLLELVVRKTKEFPKDFKYSLGEKLLNECIELVVYIYKANSASKKQEYIQGILERVQVVELLLRLSKDIHLINIDSFSEIVTLTDSIAKQAQGWSSHSYNQTKAE